MLAFSYLSLDRGFAFSQEAGHAPQITENLLTKIKESIANSFKPRVVRTYSIAEDRNLNQIIVEEEEEDELGGRNSIEGVMKVNVEESLRYNYFDGTNDKGKSINQ